jgi:MFS family permease
VSANKFLTSLAINKITAINVLLVTNAFVWYYFIIITLQNIVLNSQVNNLLVWTLHFGAIAVSALAGALISKKIKNRSTFLIVWMILGVILSAVSIWANTSSQTVILALSLLFGVGLGIGMPSCMGLFTESTAIEKRGLIGGIIFLLTGLIIVLLGLIAGESIANQSITLTLWRLFGLIVFIVFSIYHPIKDKIEKSPASYRSILKQRAFLLYLIPWVLFSLISNLTIPLQTTIIHQMQANSISIPSVEYLRAIENLLGAVFAVFGGFLADYVGRKRVAIIGFAGLGLSYSLLGIFPQNPISWYFYTAVDGIAWGTLFVIFVVTIWSDLSNGQKSEKFYAVGVLPFFITFFLRLTAGTSISATILPEAIFSLTAFMLFLAVLPLVYAPETLPEKTMKDRELKGYLEKAQKLVKKENEKKPKEEQEKTEPKEKEEEKSEPDKEEKPKNNKEYEEAKKLAEKYY